VGVRLTPIDSIKRGRDVFDDEGGINASERRVVLRMYIVCERFGDVWKEIGLVHTPEEAQAWLNEEGCFVTTSITRLRMLEGKPCE
jgi:hypothetical protein